MTQTSRIEIGARREPQCPACVAELANWAQGGYHLSCRSCEVLAVAASTIAARQAFYASIAAEARLS